MQSSRIYSSDEVVEETDIEGLYWISNYAIKTTRLSRIVLPSPGQGVFTIVTHAADFSEQEHGGYEFYGIHIGQVDVLTFLALDDRVMQGDFVDCRRGSKTFHKRVKFAFTGDPDKALVIDRGIAHIFDNLKGMVTLNQPRVYFDRNNPYYSSDFDVVNVRRSSPLDEFPSVIVNRFPLPYWLCRSALKKQRAKIRAAGSRNHPFIFHKGSEKLILTPVEKK